jgi:hypothetical protein
MALRLLIIPYFYDKLQEEQKQGKEKKLIKTNVLHRFCFHNELFP